MAIKYTMAVKHFQINFKRLINFRPVCGAATENDLSPPGAVRFYFLKKIFISRWKVAIWFIDVEHVQVVRWCLPIECFENNQH